MEILKKDSLIDTLKYMIKVVEGSPKDAYFTVGDWWISEIDKTFQKRSHKMGLERAIKQQKEIDKLKKREKVSEGNI